MSITKRLLSLALVLGITLSLSACGSNQRIGSVAPNITGGVQFDGVIGFDVAQNDGAFVQQPANSSNSYKTDSMTPTTNNIVPDPGIMPDPGYTLEEPDWNTEGYNYIEENSFRQVSVSPLSTFAADVDTASFSNVRRLVVDRSTITPSAVRLEEMLNYFKYDYEAPAENDEVPFAVTTEVAECPWNPDNMLLQIGLRTPEIDTSDMPKQNIVLLLDVSGSMNEQNKLPLLKQAMGLLVENLSNRDALTVITYSSSYDVLVDTSMELTKPEIIDIINGINADGGTNASGALEKAYEIALNNFVDDGNNLILIASDGDFNIGVTDMGSMTRYVKDMAKQGVGLSTLGFGMGNYKDNMMETLADNGNGKYYYIDTLDEAKKVLVDEMGGTLLTVARDVKYQVEFNPEVVYSYRQLGYENRQMAAEDFADDTKDGGEIGAGQTTTVLYELVMADSRDGSDSEKDVNLKYQTSKTTGSSDICTVAIRWKQPSGSNRSQLEEYPVSTNKISDNMSNNMKLASAVAELGMLLKESEYAGDSSYDSIMNLIDDITFRGDKGDYVDSLVEVVEAAYDARLIK